MARWPQWARIAAGIAGVLLLVVFGATLWFRRQVTQVREATPALQAEGREFGSGRAGGECVQKALGRRLERTDGGVAGAVADRIFLTACLEASTPDRTFCRGVPGPMQIGETIEWRRTECANRGYTDPACGRLLTAVQAHCHGAARG